MVFDHTLYSADPPLPEAHLWSPYCNKKKKKKKSARNGTYNIKNGFLLKKKSTLLANMQVRSLWKAVRPPSEAFYISQLSNVLKWINVTFIQVQLQIEYN